MRITRCGVLLVVFALVRGTAAGTPDDPAERIRTERIRALQNRTWDIQAVRIDEVVRLDGRLDDPAWQRAVPADEFFQTETNEGLPASQRTEIRVVYDARTLYVGIRCHDNSPEGVKALSLFRDEASGDDLILIAVDSFHDHRSSIQFVTNANGYMVDSLQTGETTATRNQDWDTVWDARGTLTSDGWEAELAIPFKSLRFEKPLPGEPLVFGIGFKRNLPRTNEEATWPFVSNDSSWYRPAELGHLRGLEGIEPPRSIDLRPYVLTGLQRDAFVPVSPWRGEAGIDVKWGVTPGLTADFTVNTDFAQEEVDVQQTNFTRFSLFLPEKRQFFLENQRMFQFGLPKEVDLVFTRRIGLSEAGEVVPIIGGARLSGRVGATSIGAMNLTTEAAAGLPVENFTVVRVRQDVLSRSSVGALATLREGHAGNRLVGADASFFLGQSWSVEGFYARMTDDRLARPQTASYSRLAYDADLYGASYRFLDVDAAFTPGVGFVLRPDAREQQAQVRFSPRPGLSWMRQIHTRGSFRHITNQRGVLETRLAGAELEAAFETGDIAAAGYEDRYEFLETGFFLTPDVFIPPGIYRSGMVTAKLNTFRRRKARVNLSTSHGGVWGGQQDRVVFDGYYRMTKHFGASLRYEVNWFDLPQDRFVSQLASSRIEIAFRTNMVLLPLLQYRPDTRQFSANIRYNWIPKPGTDFFVVYTELDELRRPFFVRNRSLAVKLNYLFAL